ncbi:MAG: fibronectin type III domain-containing protein, partial [Actinomycetales bacterium]|nr:fibronectin type III domain-containing protein [Actinomycetales bacterium]
MAGEHRLPALRHRLRLRREHAGLARPRCPPAPRVRAHHRVVHRGTDDVRARHRRGLADVRLLGARASPGRGDDDRSDKKPEAPAAPTLTFGDGQLTVSWTAPVNEGTPITSYDLQISPSPGGSGQISVTGTQYVWTSLTNGQAYTFRVRAINDAPDPGDWSGWSAAEIPSGPPFQPAAPSASRIDSPAGGQISVRWGAPGDNGDSIDAYYLTIYRDGVPQAAIQLSGATLDRTVSVDNAHDYSFSVVAENRAGRSPASPQSASVRSFGAPGQTTGVSA